MKIKPVAPACDIHHQGLARVLHFEVLSRASRYDPTLLSFHRFFRLAMNGDLFTFETSQLVRRHPNAVLNEPEPSAFEINTRFLETLRECPSRLRPFLEHLLVLLGLSKLWDKRDRDPVLIKDGEVMSALDYIKSDDTSDVVFGDAAVTPGEDVVVRGSEHRFEGSGYVNVPNVKCFTNAPGSKISDDIEVSAEQVPKKLVKKDSTPTIQGSSGKSVESLECPEAEEVYVPNWDMKDGDSFKDPAVYAEVLAHFAPPGVRSSISEMETDHFISRLMLSSCNLSALLAEGVTHFTKGMQKYEEPSKKKDKMEASMAAMKKEVEGFSKKEESQVKKVGELTRKHGIEKAFEEEKEGLKALVAQATGDYQWLIEQGFHQVVTYLLHSKEFNSDLGEVYTKLLNWGKHQGLIAGYKLHESSQPLEQSSMYRPEASEVFKGSVQQMERLTYLYVSQVATCFGKPLSVLQGLKPDGFNENVCVEVLDSLSRKRSRSGDNEETISGEHDASKDVSLEGSAVGDDGGSKARSRRRLRRPKVMVLGLLSLLLMFEQSS
ncbi:hypothetical protein Hanom_Chr05g00405391 [Helianthus anomalus]